MLKRLPIVNKEIKLDHGQRMGLWVETRVVVEVIAVEALNDVLFTKDLTYLRLNNYKFGLLFNSQAAALNAGFKRVIYSSQPIKIRFS